MSMSNAQQISERNLKAMLGEAQYQIAVLSGNLEFSHKWIAELEAKIKELEAKLVDLPPKD